MKRVAALHEAIAAACFGRDADALDGDLRGFLTSRGVTDADADAIVAAPRRLGLYRRLVRHNVVGVTRTMMPRARARMNAAHDEAFDRAMDAFLDELGPRTHHLRDVPREFLSWAAPRWRDEGAVPAWMVELAELELTDFTVGVAPRPPEPPPLADVSHDRPLVFQRPVEVLRFAWAVHALPQGVDDRTPPEPRPSVLLVYRDAEHRTRFLDLSPLAAEILGRLLAGDPLGAAMVEACRASGEPLTQDVLTGAAHLLADLGERGVLLGARAS